MAATDAGTIHAEIRVEIEALKKDLNTAISLFRQTAESIDDTSKKSGTSINRLKGSIKDLAAPFIAAKMAADMLIGAVKSLMSFLSSNVMAYVNHQTELAKLESLLRSTGGAAWTTSGQLAEMADKFSRSTRFMQDDIMKAQAVLLGFNNITGDTFERVMKAAMDTATVMGTDLTSAINLYGKALEDPINGMMALNRNGFGFRQEDRAMIAQLIESEGIYAGRAAILEKIETAYGGTAEAAAAATAAVTAHMRSQKASEELSREMGRQTGGMYAGLVDFWSLIKESYALFFKSTEDMRSVPGEIERMSAAYAQAVAPVRELSNEIIRLENQFDEMLHAFQDANRGIYSNAEELRQAFLNATPAARALSEQIRILNEERAPLETRTAQMHVEILEKELELYEAQYYELVRRGRHATEEGEELLRHISYHNYLIAQAKQYRNERQQIQARLTEEREDIARLNQVEADEMEKINEIERERARIVAETNELYRRGAIQIDEFYSRIESAYQSEAQKLNAIYIASNTLNTTAEGRLRIQQRSNAALDEAIRLQLAWNRAAANRNMTEREFIQERDEILARYTRAVNHLNKMREARQIDEATYEQRILNLQRQRIEGLDELIARSGFEAPVTMAMVEDFQNILNLQERTVEMYKIETDLLEDAKDMIESRLRLGMHEVEIGNRNLEQERQRLQQMVERGQIAQWVADMYLDSMESLNTAMARQDVTTALEDYNQRLARLSMTTKQLLETERREALRNIEVYRDTEGYDALVAGINRYYDALKKTEGWKVFAQNFNMYMNEAMKTFQAISDAIVTASRRQTEEQIKDLEKLIGEKKKLLDEELQHRLYLLGYVEAATQEQHERELELAIESGDQQRIYQAHSNMVRFQLEEEYAEKQKALDEYLAREKAELEYRQAMLEWRLRLAMAIASAAQAVVAASVNMWPVPAIPMMALATATGIAQVAALSAAKPVKQFAMGGILPGDSMSGDKVLFAGNSREMILNLDQQQNLHDRISNNDLGGDSTMTLIVYLDGEIIAKNTVNRINNRHHLIEARSVLQ